MEIEDLKNLELNALPVYDDGYIKTKIRTYRDNFYTVFYDLNVPEDDIECETFTVISIDYLVVYEKKQKHLKIFLDNCAYNIANKQMTDDLDYIFFED